MPQTRQRSRSPTKKSSSPTKKSSSVSPTRSPSPKKAKTMPQQPKVTFGISVNIELDGETEEYLSFLKDVFKANDYFRMNDEADPSRIFHSAVNLNDRCLMVNDFSPLSDEHKKPNIPLISFCLTFDDPEGAAEAFMKAGKCECILPVELRMWGSKYGLFKDPFGIYWSFSSNSEKDRVPVPKELREKFVPEIGLNDAKKAASFYEKAFNAKILETHANPEGKVMHMVVEFNQGGRIFLCDFTKEKGPNICLSLNVDNAKAIGDRFSRHNGSITEMPVQKVFWGSIYGRFKDPWGINWAVNQWLNEEEKKESMLHWEIINNLPATHFVGIRKKFPYEKIKDIMGTMFSTELPNALKENNIPMGTMMTVIYSCDREGDIDIATATHVNKAMKAPKDMVSGSFGGDQKAIRATMKGSYEKLPESWNEFHSIMEINGMTPQGSKPYLEFYRISYPQTSIEADFETDLFALLQK